MAALRIALAGLALLASPVRAAEPAPPSGLADEAEVFQSPPNVPKPFIASLQLGVFKLVFEETRLSQLREAVGAGIIDHQGDAHASLYWLCYTAVGEGGTQRIWITSGELYHGVEADSFTAEKLGEGETASPACPVLPARFMPLSAGNGIWLGMTLAEIERRIGAKAKRSGAYFVFSSQDSDIVARADERLQRTTPQEAFTSNRVVVEMEGNRAVRLWVHKLTTT